ncbi:hypothetical protein KEM54_002139, partial [Ascosphaera aggregata]
MLAERPATLYTQSLLRGYLKYSFEQRRDIRDGDGDLELVRLQGLENASNNG